MAAEFIVAGRVPLPGGETWELLLKDARGSVLAWAHPEQGDQNGKISGTVGFKPRSVVIVRKAWELGQVVAEALATALAGAVFCDVDHVVFLDARDTAQPVSSRAELEVRLRHAFDHPEPFFERWEREEQERFERERASDPNTVAADDWSDV